MFYPPFQTAYRGVKNPEAVERKRKKQEEIEKTEMTTSVSGGGGGLRVSFALILQFSDHKYNSFKCSETSKTLCSLRSQPAQHLETLNHLLQVGVVNAGTGLISDLILEV